MPEPVYELSDEGARKFASVADAVVASNEEDLTEDLEKLGWSLTAIGDGRWVLSPSDATYEITCLGEAAMFHAGLINQPNFGDA